MRPHSSIIFLDAQTGLRLGELLDLIWDDFDKDADTINVS
jgi:integrase